MSGFDRRVVKQILLALLFVLACALAQAVPAQSTDQSLPTPVLANDINGQIAALDLGDPRATRYFYAFAANPGDLLVTVDSKNLNGDIDVFTAITFRPLMKTTVYATSQSPPITKGIYLRAHQLLILRIEARTPNDDPGIYHIRFGGTFEAFSGGIPVAETTDTAETSNSKTSSNRLSSVGATIPRPPAEMVEPAEAKAVPSPEKTEEKPPEKTSDTAETRTTAEKPARNTTARNTTSRPPRRSTRPAPSRRQPPPKKTDSTAKSDSSETTSTKVEPSTVEKTDTSREEKPAEKTDKSTESTTSTDKAKPQEVVAPPAGARLIIEEKDGTRIERPMSTIRRVIVEGPTIMVILKTGKIERVPMISVARMSIEPQ